MEVYCRKIHFIITYHNALKCEGWAEINMMNADRDRSENDAVLHQQQLLVEKMDGSLKNTCSNIYSQEAALPSCRLYVGNLHFSTTEGIMKQIEKHFLVSLTYLMLFDFGMGRGSDKIIPKCREGC